PTTCVARRAVSGRECALAPVWRACSSSLALSQLGERSVAMAIDEMVVDHADRLHEGVDDGRAAELEPTGGELLRHLARDVGLCRDLLGGAEMVHLRLAVDEVPQQCRKAFVALHDLQPSLG